MRIILIYNNKLDSTVNKEEWFDTIEEAAEFVNNENIEWLQIFKEVDLTKSQFSKFIGLLKMKNER